MAITLTENYSAVISSTDPDTHFDTIAARGEESRTPSAPTGGGPGKVTVTNTAGGTLINFGDLTLGGGYLRIENPSSDTIYFGADNAGALLKVGEIPPGDWTKWYHTAGMTLRCEASGGAPVAIKIKAWDA